MKKYFAVLILILASLTIVFPVAAQEDEIRLSLSRDFGFSSGTGDIQGRFSMKVSGPDSMVRVEFYVDDKVIGTDDEAPFRIQFSTDSFSPGRHTMSAVGYSADGQEYRTRSVAANFLSAEEARSKTFGIVIPIVVVVFGAILISAVVPMITGKGKLDQLPLGEKRNYGFRGGGICPKCHRPFSLHIYGLNLLTHKLDRCPYCGKWSLVRRASQTALREAEKAELDSTEDSKRPSELSEDEKLRKDLDDSRYHGP